MLLRETALLRLLGLAKIPMIASLLPSVLRLDAEGADVRVPLNYFTKNHAGGMYLGALCTGADVAVAACTVDLIRSRFRELVPIFRSLEVEFLKRADGDVVFTCNDRRAVEALFDEAQRTGERLHREVSVLATVPSRYGAEPVARFRLELSVKARRQ